MDEPKLNGEVLSKVVVKIMNKIGLATENCVGIGTDGCGAVETIQGAVPQFIKALVTIIQ